MRSNTVLMACLFTLGLSSIANAIPISIRVEQDVSIKSTEPGVNFNNQGHPFLWVGDNTGSVDHQGMFGFDVTALTSLLSPGDSLIINSMTFRAYNNFNRWGAGNVDVSLGNTDVWDAFTANYTNFGNQHGPTIDSLPFPVGGRNAPILGYQGWNVTSVGAAALLDDYVTFYLSAVPGALNFHDFEAEEFVGGVGVPDNAAYLDIDYDIQATAVPEPSSLVLMGIGAASLIRRRWSGSTKG